VKVITGTAGEAIHILDGLVSHDSTIDILAHHTDGGGVSDHVFAAMYLLGVKFQPPACRARTIAGYMPSKQRAATAR
jgi:TnpA family transposase